MRQQVEMTDDKRTGHRYIFLCVVLLVYCNCTVMLLVCILWCKAKAEPGLAEAHQEGSGFEFDKPKPIKAEPKLRYLGRAELEHH